MFLHAALQIQWITGYCNLSVVTATCQYLLPPVSSCCHMSQVTAICQY